MTIDYRHFKSNCSEGCRFKIFLEIVQPFALQSFRPLLRAFLLACIRLGQVLLPVNSDYWNCQGVAMRYAKSTSARICTLASLAVALVMKNLATSTVSSKAL